MRSEIQAESMALSGSAAAELPLPTLLSQTLVAITIECDNEFEHRVPHRITDTSQLPGSRGNVWLTSLVMWSNLLKYVDENGVTVRHLQRRAGIESLSLAGMQRWRYITVAPDPVDSSRKVPQSDWMVRATPAGQRVQLVWPAVLAEIEDRWRERFGVVEITGLRESLHSLAARFDARLPDFLPVLGYGLFSRCWEESRTTKPDTGDTMVARDADLPALLSKVLLTFAMDFEREWDVSLAICANVLRVLEPSGVRIRDLPRLAGVSKEAIQMAAGWLERSGYLVAEPDPNGSRAKLARLTSKGQNARSAYWMRLQEIEESWKARFGETTIRDLRKSLECLVGDDSAQMSPLFRGIMPYPDGWRASAPKPEILPHFPMVLHRGGYPDGS